jgi:7,8-dihydropterin-6-yl-methyl-4-(beta-D-ribofuranosyl)aminobenzene 5'-phosphate synthase
MNISAEITILVNNTGDDGLLIEHGLAFWIETAGSCILLDAGQGKALEHNAPLLGINLENAASLVLSHGHYDHSGGIAHVLDINSQVHVYCHPGVVVPRYSIKSAEEIRTITMPQDARAALNALPPERLHWVTQPVLLAPTVGITGPIARKSDFEDPGGPFFFDTSRRNADPIDDDQALWIKTPRGLIIVAGCSHSGVKNTIDAVREIAGEKSIVALIGGFHLKDASEERINKTAAVLQDLDAEVIISCHCTGDRATEVLHAVLGDRVRSGRAGMKIRV